MWKTKQDSPSWKSTGSNSGEMRFICHTGGGGSTRAWRHRCLSERTDADKIRQLGGGPLAGGFIYFHREREFEES